MRTKKAFPEDEVVWKVRQTTQDWADVLQNRFELEKRIGKRWQVSTELVHELEAHHGQLTEVEPGLKYVAYFDALRTFIASVGMTAAVPLNQPDAEWAAVPYVAFAKGRGPNFTLQGSVKANLPTDEFQRDGNVELASVLHFLPPGMPPRGVFPGLEVIVGVPFERAGQDAVQVALAPQMRICPVETRARGRAGTAQRTGSISFAAMPISSGILPMACCGKDGEADLDQGLTLRWVVFCASAHPA